MYECEWTRVHDRQSLGVYVFIWAREVIHLYATSALNV